MSCIDIMQNKKLDKSYLFQKIMKPITVEISTMPLISRSTIFVWGGQGQGGKYSSCPLLHGPLSYQFNAARSSVRIM